VPKALKAFLQRPDVTAAAAVMILRALTLGSRFMLSLLLARMLPTAEFGQYGLITAVLAFALLAVGLEFYAYTMRQMVPAEPGQRVRIIADQIVLAALMLCLTAGVVVGAVWLGVFPLRIALWFLLILTTEHLSLEATRVLIIISRPVRAYIGVFLRGGIWVFVIAVLMFTEPSLRRLETVLLWWAFGGVASVVFAAASLTHLPWRELRQYRPDPVWIWNGLRAARPFMLTAISALTLTYFDRFLIEQALGLEALGIYTFYSTIAIGILSLSTSISQQFLPKVLAGFAAGPIAFRKVLRTYAWALGVVGAAVVAVAGTAIWPIMAVLNLEAYAAVLPVFYVMLIGVFVRMLADVPSYTLYAAHADAALLACNLGAAVVSISLNFTLIPALGLMGAAFANAVASATLCLALGILAWRKINASAPEAATSNGKSSVADLEVLKL
jgi:O-antigen/teichoic acid export membrane protein